jgi:hypothetical protein
VHDLLDEAAVGGDLLPRPGVRRLGHHAFDPLQRLLQRVGPRVGQQAEVALDRGVEMGGLVHPGPQLFLGEAGHVEGADLKDLRGH